MVTSSSPKMSSSSEPSWGIGYLVEGARGSRGPDPETVMPREELTQELARSFGEKKVALYVGKYVKDIVEVK